jgi:hypothetical protein
MGKSVFNETIKVEADFKDLMKTTIQEDNEWSCHNKNSTKSWCSATECPSSGTTDEILKGNNTDNEAHLNSAKKDIEAILHH